MTKETSNNSKKIKLYILVGVLIIASIAFRFISNFNFDQTSILFVGLPALITLLMIKYSKTPKSAYGIVFKVITLFLLMSSILLGEGIVCILFMAPIFYGVSAIIVFIFKSFDDKNNSKLSSIVIIPILLVLAQPFEIKAEPEMQSVESSITVYGNVSIDSLNKHPDFLKDYPNFFKIGFPKPIDIQGTGTDVGDDRYIKFESRTKGIGTLSLEVINKDESSITFNPTSDDTHINHWLTWHQMKVEIIELTPTETQIKWTSQYQCDLGPGWYFEPLERFTVGIMNEHLLNAYFN